MKLKSLIALTISLVFILLSHITIVSTSPDNIDTDSENTTVSSETTTTEEYRSSVIYDSTTFTDTTESTTTESTTTENTATTITLDYIPSEEDIIAIARTLYGECRGIESDMQKAAVAWVILNRVDAGYGDIIEVITAPYQFVGYKSSHPILDELYDLAEDVLVRWYSEKEGNKNAGRVIPPDYLWFTGDGEYNYFRNDFYSDDYWDWTLGNPYN